MTRRRPEPPLIRYGWIIGTLGALIGLAVLWAVVTGRLPLWVIWL